MEFNSNKNDFLETSIFSGSNIMTTIQFIISIICIVYFSKILLSKNTNIFQNNKFRKLCIITDPDDEIDDEIALYHMFEEIKKNNSSFPYQQVLIIFANGQNGKNKTSNQRKKVFFDFFPEFKSESCIVNGVKINFITADEMKHIKNFEIDTMLQIAPLCGLGTQFFASNIFKRRVVMGDLDNPKGSLNLSKSWNEESPNFYELEKEFQAQQKALINVPSHYITTKLSRGVPFTYNMINKLPKNFRDYILKKAFQLLVGRVPSHLPYCKNVTVGANWPTAKSYLRGWDDDDFDRYFNKLQPKTKNIIQKQVDEFMAGDKDSNFRQALEDIYLVVHRITGQSYISSDFSVNNLTNVDEAEKRFADFIRENKSSLTPAYDLLAMHIVLRKKFDYEKYDENFMGELMEELNIFYG